MDDDTLLGIGAFAVLSGLSITALRHYDEVRLLVPVRVDASTGYRRYTTEQVRTGRLIRSLRAVDLSIDDIRDLLAAGDPDARRAVLVTHRSRLQERTETLSTMLSTLDTYIEKGMTMADKPPCRVAEINLGAHDMDQARHFYETVFQVELTEDHHGDGFWHLLAAFGSWPSDEFFLVNIHEARFDEYRAGRADFGLLVDDLDAVHARAITSGGVELSAPHDASGMPRCSTICDPSGNSITLYQNV